MLTRDGRKSKAEADARTVLKRFVTSQSVLRSSWQPNMETATIVPALGGCTSQTCFNPVLRKCKRLAKRFVFYPVWFPYVSPPPLPPTLPNLSLLWPLVSLHAFFIKYLKTTAERRWGRRPTPSTCALGVAAPTNIGELGIATVIDCLATVIFFNSQPIYNLRIMSMRFQRTIPSHGLVARPKRRAT